MIRRWPIQLLAIAGAIACSPEKSAEMSVRSPAALPVETSVEVSRTNETVRPSEGVRMACDLPQTPEDAPRFAYDEAELRLRGEKILDDVAKCLRDGPLKDEEVRVVGFADPRGSDSYNLDLGMSRAEAAREYLAGNGVPQDRVDLASCGEREATGHDETTWAYDRRIELTLAGEPLPGAGCNRSSM